MSDELAPGTQLAGFRIDGRLGEGGMGVVYEAYQASLEREVALKVVAPALSRDPAFRERFRREGVLQAKLAHPNVLAVHDSGEAGGRLYMAMALVRGPNLKDLVGAGGLAVERALHLLEQVAAALDAAHAAGMVHRDVKPQNILVGPGDHAFLADFGLSLAAGSRGLTRPGHMLGTVEYSAPEQLRSRAVGPQADVYALAAVAYECLTGDVPFPHDSDAAIVAAHVSDPRPAVSAARADLSPAVDAVVAAGMAVDPAERPPSAGAFVAQLRAALQSAPVPGPRRPQRASKTVVDRVSGVSVIRPAEPARPGAGRGFYAAAAIVAVAAAAGGVVAGAAGREAPRPAVVTRAVGTPDARAGYRATLGSTLAALDATRVPARRRLARAPAAADQARAATDLAAAYLVAARRLDVVQAPGPDVKAVAAVRAALRRAATAYAALAAAARGRDRVRYRRAAAAVGAAEGALATTIGSGFPIR